MRGGIKSKHLRRRLLIAPVFVALAIWAAPAGAQVSWHGPYAGADIGIGFKTVSFTVTDHQLGQTSLGDVDVRTSLSGHGGVDFRLNKHFSFGGEASVGQLSYLGQTSYGSSNDVAATTKGGPMWTVVGRAGWVYRQMMPYVAVGVLGSRNTVEVTDDCSSPPCGTELSSGLGSQAAINWIVAYGLEYAGEKRIAGHGWAIRVEWMQLERKAIQNDFNKTVRTTSQPDGFQRAVSASTELPAGLLRVLFDVRLTRSPK